MHAQRVFDVVGWIVAQKLVEDGIGALVDTVVSLDADERVA